MKMRSLLGLLLVAYIGCSDSAQDPVEITLKGHYLTRFETSAFIQCGSDERWWVEGPALSGVDNFLRQSQSLPPRHEQDGLQDGRVFVIWKGVLSPTGKYGHMGSYTRRLIANEILEIRLAEDSDCDSGV